MLFTNVISSIYLIRSILFYQYTLFYLRCQHLMQQSIPVDLVEYYSSIYLIIFLINIVYQCYFCQNFTYQYIWSVRYYLINARYQNSIYIVNIIWESCASRRIPKSAANCSQTKRVEETSGLVSNMFDAKSNETRWSIDRQRSHAYYERGILPPVSLSFRHKFPERRDGHALHT